MRDAIGGALTLEIIVVFMIIINCYLAFSVNYTKAFRVKNEIRSIVEKNEGLTCSAMEQINELMLKTKYTMNPKFESWCRSNGYEVATTPAGSFCYQNHKLDVYGSSSDTTLYSGAYYTIVTFVNVDIPLINNLLPYTANIFLISGETSQIYSSGNNSEISACGY